MIVEQCKNEVLLQRVWEDSDQLCQVVRISSLNAALFVTLNSSWTVTLIPKSSSFQLCVVHREIGNQM